MRNPYEHPVVAGVTGSEPTPVTVDTAAAEAVLRGLPLTLLSAFRGEAGPRTGLTAQLRRVASVWPKLPATGRNLSGALGPELVAASAAASLLVVGRDATAPVVSQVVAYARCPVLVVPPVKTAPAGGPVLLALGLTAGDEPAVAFAFEAAALRRVPLLAVHVWSGPPARGEGRYAYDLRRAQAVADEVVAGELAAWSGKYPEVPVDRMPLYDADPARTLLDASELAGLVVLASTRRGGQAGSGDPDAAALGGVCRTLLGHCSRPVVVVHPAGNLTGQSAREEK